MGLTKQKTASNSGEICINYWTIVNTNYDQVGFSVNIIVCGFTSKNARNAGDAPQGQQIQKGWKITDLLTPESVQLELNTENNNLTPELFWNLKTSQQRAVLYHNLCLPQPDENGNETNFFADAISDL